MQRFLYNCRVSLMTEAPSSVERDKVGLYATVPLQLSCVADDGSAQQYREGQGRPVCNGSLTTVVCRW